jgi:pimeloyl-ACP methyl ester carboxylesterase
MRIRWLLLLFMAGCSSVPTTPTDAKRDAVLSMDPGDFSAVHPLEKPKPQIEQLAGAIPQDAKDHTHLFFINGLDPYYLANFRGQCQYIKALGYNNAYCGQLHQTQLFRDRILQVRKDDTEARIVVIGYSFGANSARTLANQLKDDGARIDLLVYLGGDTVKDSDTSRPANVGRIVNITGHGSMLLGYDLFVNGDEIKGASNHRLDARHFLLPTRAEATELLVQSVAELERARPERDDLAVMQAGFLSLKR